MNGASVNGTPGAKCDVSAPSTMTIQFKVVNPDGTTGYSVVNEVQAGNGQVFSVIFTSADGTPVQPVVGAKVSAINTGNNTESESVTVTS
jgi:hypothetical protein